MPAAATGRPRPGPRGVTVGAQCRAGRGDHGSAVRGVLRRDVGHHRDVQRRAAARAVERDQPVGRTVRRSAANHTHDTDRERDRAPARAAPPRPDLRSPPRRCRPETTSPSRSARPSPVGTAATGVASRTAPSGRRAASWAGMAPMPAAGTAEEPTASDRSTMSNMRRLAVRSASSWMPPTEWPEEPFDHALAEAVDAGARRMVEMSSPRSSSRGSRGGAGATASPDGPCRRSFRPGRTPTTSNEPWADAAGRRPGAAFRHTTPTRRGRTRRRCSASTSSWRCSSGYAVSSDLEAAVEVEAVDLVGADPAADAVRRLEQQHRAAAGAPAGRPQPVRRARHRRSPHRPVRRHGRNLPPGELG